MHGHTHSSRLTARVTLSNCASNLGLRFPSPPLPPRSLLFTQPTQLLLPYQQPWERSPFRRYVMEQQENSQKATAMAGLSAISVLICLWMSVIRKLAGTFKKPINSRRPSMPEVVQHCSRIHQGDALAHYGTADGFILSAIYLFFQIIWICMKLTVKQQQLCMSSCTTQA